MPAGASEDFSFCAVEIDSLLLLLLLEYVCYGSYTVVTTMIRPPMTKIPMFIFPEVVEYSADSRTSNRGRLFVRYRPLQPFTKDATTSFAKATHMRCLKIVWNSSQSRIAVVLAAYIVASFSLVYLPSTVPQLS